MIELKGRYAEDYIYEFVNKHKGLSIYEIAKRIGWSNGKVHNIIKSLENTGLVKTIVEVEHGRTKRKVYPVPWTELLPED
jgi:predicted transcriptional regulator